MSNINLKSHHFEYNRKMFHMLIMIFPLIYILISKLWMILICLPILGVILYLDITRHYEYKVRNFIDTFFKKFIRVEESSGSFNLSGASYMIFGVFLSTVLFSKELAIASMMILAIADCVAALVGVNVGRYMINQKSLEGSIAFFMISVVVSILCYFFIGLNSSILTILIASFVTTIVELYSKQIKINDNLLIPLVYGITTMMLNFIAEL